MATSLILTSFFSYALLSILFTSTFVKGDLVTNVCIKTSVPSLCEKLLRSDPRSKTADLKTLGTITLNMTTDLIKSTSTMVNSLIDKTKNATFKELYTSCSSFYTYVEYSREIAIGYYGVKNYGQVIFYMTESISDVRSCDYGFVYKSVYEEDEKLRQASLSLQQYFTAIIVIAIRL
uniref:Pectinesterase inhibitor n=1 Tax=Solanum tuberosum TaxID=4113 RepID=M1DZE8_SOLTU